MKLDFIKHYHETVVKHDFINKFNFTKQTDIPEMKRLGVSFSSPKTEIKFLAPAFLTLKLVTKKRGKILKAKKSRLIPSVKKGDPIGCSATIKGNNKILTFLFKIVNDVVLSEKKNMEEVNFKTFSSDRFFFYVNDFEAFEELESRFSAFKDLTPMQITCKTQPFISDKAFKFLLHSLKFPIKQ